MTPGKKLDVEIVSLFARSSCLKPNDFPLANPMSLIGSFINGDAIICGFLGNTSFCYGLDLIEQSWKVLNFTMSEQRAQAAGARLENGSWIIFGGQKYSEGVPIILNTSEILIDSNFQLGPQLPMHMSGHCIVNLGKNSIFIAGGYGQPFLKHAFILKINNATSWESVIPMHQGRYGHVCGKVLNSFNDVQIIAAGGLRVDKVEIYLYKKQYWINGPNMMRDNFFKAVSVQGPSSFLLVGGLELEPCSMLNCQLKEIYIFDRNLDWQASKQELNKGRGNHIALGLPPRN